MMQETVGSNYCNKCGDPITGSFCSACGSKVVRQKMREGVATREKQVAPIFIGSMAVNTTDNQIIFHDAAGVESHRCSFNDFAQLSTNKSIDSILANPTVNDRIVVTISQQIDGVQIKTTLDVPQAHYLGARGIVDYFNPKVDTAELAANVANYEQLRKKRERVDGGLLTYSPKTEDGTKFSRAETKLADGSDFPVYVPAELLNILDGALCVFLTTASNLTQDSDTFNLAGHTINKAQLLSTLSGNGQFYPFRRELINPRLSLNDVKTHQAYLPVNDINNKPIIISIDQTILVELFAKYEKQIDQPAVRMSVENTLKREKHVVTKSEHKVNVGIAKGLVRKGSYVREGQRFSESIDVQAGTTIGDRFLDANQERAANQDMLVARTVEMADGTIVTILRVYDGMGGHGHGEQASKTAAANEINFLTTLTEKQIKAIKDRAQKKNRSYEVELADVMLKYIAKTTVSQIPAEAGTTMSGSLIINGKCIVTSKGDSKTYVFRGGKPVLRTIDHSLVARLVATKQITPDEAVHHPQKNVIYKTALDEGRDGNVVATHPMQEFPFEIAEIVLEEGDVIISMCDGVAGGIETQGRDIEQELQAMIAAKSQDAALYALNVLAEGSGDNDTFLMATYHTSNVT